MAWYQRRDNGYYYIYWYEGKTGDGRPKKRMKSLRAKNAARARAAFKLLEEQIYFRKQGFITLEKIEIEKFAPRLESYLFTNYENVGTRKDYLGSFRRFAASMNEKYKYISQLHEVKDVHISEFKEYVREKGKSLHTINSELTAVKKVFKIAKELNHTNANPAVGVSRITVSNPPIELYSQDEIRMMLRFSKDNPMLETIVLLLLQAAPRRQEIIHFIWKDFNTEEATLKVSRKDNWRPKKNKERILKLSHRLRDMIEGLERRNEYIFTQTEGRNNGKKFSTGEIYRYLIKRFVSKLGIKGDIHKFRDTYASYSIASGVDVAKVQWRLGHSSLNETNKYAMAINEPIADDIKKLFLGEQGELQNG